MGLLGKYRDNWPRVGALMGMGIAGATALGSRKLSRPQTFAALNFAALTVHQYEEYEDPGYFPGQFNAGVLHSEVPDRYPLNTNTALTPAVYAQTEQRKQVDYELVWSLMRFADEPERWPGIGQTNGQTVPGSDPDRVPTCGDG